MISFSFSMTYKLLTQYSMHVATADNVVKHMIPKKQMACSRQTVIAHKLKMLSLLSLLPLTNSLTHGFPQSFFVNL